MREAMHNSRIEAAKRAVRETIDTSTMLYQDEALQQMDRDATSHSRRPVEINARNSPAHLRSREDHDACVPSATVQWKTKQIVSGFWD